MTSSSHEGSSGDAISIHTTTQVVTLTNKAYVDFSKISIHTTTQVVTNMDRERASGCQNFNPHHHAGGDEAPPNRLERMQNFNPHHHAGGDSNSTQLFIPIFDNFHKNLLLQPITTSTSTKSIKKNTIYSCFLRCEPPRVFMGTSPSHGHV